MTERERRWNGWGFADESASVPQSARTWLSDRLGVGDPLSAVDERDVHIPPARALPDLPAATLREPGTRLRFACGGSFPDLVSLRTGSLPALPDAVCLPENEEEVVAVLGAAAASDIAVIPRGGGTSVVGGVTVRPGPRPTVVLALDRMRGLTLLDSASLLASFRAGTLGPEVEAALAPHRMRLGHEPQSFEFSTVGGWVATRSAGQRSTGIGKIDELVAGLEIATREGVWRLPAQPASAAGPELRRLLIGSEGRFGVITEATLRARPLPEARDGVAVLLSGWSAGMEACRALLQRGPTPEVMRLSDPDETSFGIALTELPRLASSVRNAIFGMRRFRHGCLLLLEWAGALQDVTLARQAAAGVWRDAGGLALGRTGWWRWLDERFRHPYVRDTLLSGGWGVDTLESAARWSSLEGLHEAVREAMIGGAERTGFRIAVLCHLSHAYRDGASLYFTFLWPLRRGDETAQWQVAKDAASEAILAHGGTITHHHGVGAAHAPYLEREVGAPGIAALEALARTFDPRGVLNPGVLLFRTPNPEPRTPGGSEG